MEGKKSELFVGLGAGEHGDSVEEFKSIVKNFKGIDLVSVRLRAVEYPEEIFYEVARIAKEHGIRFGFLYAYQFPPKGKVSHLNASIIKKVKEIAGDLFLGELMGEAGSDRAAKARGYYKEIPDCMATEMPPQNYADMREARNDFVKYVGKMADYDREIGCETILVEATALVGYVLEAGIGTPILEVMPFDPDRLIPFTRGAAAGYSRPRWGGFVANEWYGGYFHEDRLKHLRLRLAFSTLFLTGANIVYLESGYAGIHSFGCDLPPESSFSEMYREELRKFSEFAHSEIRPAERPRVKVAFLRGNFDGYTGFMGSSVWSQFDREAWGFGDPEQSWRILGEVYRGASWSDPTCYGPDDDYSNAPAWGQYDVLPIESPVEVMEQYDLLLFCGWNTMTEESYEKLKCYVADGGTLLISAAHLNTEAARDASPVFLRGGDLAEFLGADLVGIDRVNDGIKFLPESLVEGVRYPGSANGVADCKFARGYYSYVRVVRRSARIAAFYDTAFSAPTAEPRPALLENRYKNGVVLFDTHVNHPGSGAVYDFYRTVVKSLLAATHRTCSLKVTGSDKVRFAFYDGTLYLLNTSFTVPETVRVRYKTFDQTVTVDPTALTKVCLEEA